MATKTGATMAAKKTIAVFVEKCTETKLMIHYCND